MPLTDDPNDPRLTRGIDAEPGPQAEVYLVLSEEERAKGFVRPLRRAYVHDTCGVETRMGLSLCETYARDPGFYGATYCVGCQMHRPLGEFAWVEDGQRVGSLMSELVADRLTRELLIHEVAERISFRDWVLEVDEQTLRWHYMATDPDSGRELLLAGRPLPLWHVPQASLERETVTTAFLGVRLILEHEAREEFVYDGGRPFNPHTRAL